MAFRDLLWARAYARSLPTTLVNITLDVFTADGGIDASIADDGTLKTVGDDLLMSGTRFQIKTGDFAPWQASQITNEFFKKRAQAFDNLGSEIQRTLRDGRRFVLVCFGIDPTNKQIQDAKKNIRDVFAKCGFPEAKVEVWGQNHLVGLFREYPSLCLRLKGHDQQGFRSFDSWSADADMQPYAHYSPERQQLIEELRNELLAGKTHHLRLIGEPGIGKTRLALEIVQQGPSPATLYIAIGESLLRSSFINELIQTDDHRCVLLVVDDCIDKDRAEIWNVLKSKGNRVRLITIDHGPDTSVDERMRTEVVDSVGFEQIVAILMSHDVDEDDARRWAELCEGCPRVAHVIGDNLRMKRPDLLLPPAHVDVWERFIVGHDDPSSEEVKSRKLVLAYLSLFEMFGFESPVDREGRFIANLLSSVDPHFTWVRFQSTIRTLKDRRIVQGGRTLYVTPRALQIYLFSKFWDNYGVGLDIAELLVHMPKELWNWFVQTLRYAHTSPSAERAIDCLLDKREHFPSGQFPNSSGNGQIINVLSESNPKSTLRCLQRTVGRMDTESLRRIDAPCQFIVWALEKIAVWEDTFDGAARLLLKLAVAENADCANNATGTFKQLFSLIPNLAVTQAPPAQRLGIISETLDSISPDERKLGLEACHSALDRSHTFRTVGPEHQGLRRTIQFWTPKTWGELWNAHKDVWALLTSKVDCWHDDDREQLIDTIIRSAWSALHTPTLTQAVVDTLRNIANDPKTNIAALNEFIRRQLRNKHSKLEDHIKRQLNLISQSLDGTDMHSKLRRFVKFSSWEDFHDDEYNPTNRVDLILDGLADEALANESLLNQELPWLVCEDTNNAYWFAFKLARRDVNYHFLQRILDTYRLRADATYTTFLSGYLRAIFDRDPKYWETLIQALSESPITAGRLSDFVVASGMSETAVKAVIVQCRSGKQQKERLQRMVDCAAVRGNARIPNRGIDRTTT